MRIVLEVLLRFYELVWGGWMAAVFLLLYMVGLCGLFRKSGIRGFWAFVPCAREHQLGRIAGRDLEGRVVTFLTALITVFMLVELIPVQDEETRGRMILMCGVINFTLSIIRLIYKTRILLSLCEVYGRKPRWVLLWVIPDLRIIPALIWGWKKSFVPGWKVEDIRNESLKLFSGRDVDEMQEGLTVNLEERSTTEFFQKKVLLRDIHMNIQPGHMVLLLGGSGAGKTTYLNAVNGYEKAKAKVILNGNDIYRQYKKMQYQVGFVPQQELMRGKDTVGDTLLDASLLRLPSGISGADRKARVSEVMEKFGLTASKGHLVEKLSGGQKKRLSISMELISNPSLFILDEPDSGLDGVMARKLMVQLREIADQGKIVIVITHTPDRVVDLFDDVIVLAKDKLGVGRLAYYGPIEEARSFFGRERMEDIVMCINRQSDGGEGRADEFIKKYAEVQYGKNPA